MKQVAKWVVGIGLSLSITVQVFAAGGDAFETVGNGDKYRYFSGKETGELFAPSELPEFEPIRKQLDALKLKIPKAVGLIEASFKDAAIWTFVEPQYQTSPITPEKKVPYWTGGEKKLTLFDRSTGAQASVADVERNEVKINRTVWSQLTPESRSYLLFNQAMWIVEKSTFAYKYVNPELKIISGHVCGESSATTLTVLNQNDIVTDANRVHSLAELFMNPMVAKPDGYSAQRISDLMTPFAAQVNGRTLYHCHLSGELIRKLEAFSDPVVTTGAPVGAWNVNVLRWCDDQKAIDRTYGKGKYQQLRKNKQVVAVRQSALVALVDMDLLDCK